MYFYIPDVGPPIIGNSQRKRRAPDINDKMIGYL